jgi:Flp pilus assembly protein TadG
VGQKYRGSPNNMMKIFPSFRKASRYRSRGVIAVELALVSIPLVMMSLTVFEYGRAMFLYNTLVKATRDGARYLSGFDPTDASNYPTANALNRVVYGYHPVPSNTQPLVPGLTASMVGICDRVSASACPSQTFVNVPAGASGTVNLVTVRITGYTFVPLVPGVSRLLSVTFDPISTTMRQVL